MLCNIIYSHLFSWLIWEFYGGIKNYLFRMFLGHEAEVTSSNLPFSITLGPKLTYIKKKKKKERNICWSCSRTRKHRHFIWGCHTRVRHRTHLWHLCMRVLASFFFFFCWKNCRTLEGHLSILNNYLVIFYLLFWILFLVCIVISKHHIYIYIYIFFDR